MLKALRINMYVKPPKVSSLPKLGLLISLNNADAPI